MKRCLSITGVLWLLASPAAAHGVGDVVIFGDSLSDPGNIPLLTDGVNFPPSPPYSENRFSNGWVYSELLPDLLGISCDPRLNFATGGALTGADNLNSNRPSDDPGSDLSGILLPGIETQVDGFLANGGELDDHDLVIVYGGANDVFVAAEIAATLPPEEIPALIETTAATAARNLAASVLKLNAAGGDYFILPNLPDIGATPSFRAGGPASVALGTSFSVAHNLALAQAAAELREQTGAKIVIFDINAIFAAIRKKPELFGITNTTEACLETPSCLTADRASQNEFMFFDGVHPTAGVHAVAAEVLAKVIKWKKITASDQVQSRIIDGFR